MEPHSHLDDINCIQHKCPRFLNSSPRSWSLHIMTQLYGLMRIYIREVGHHVIKSESVSMFPRLVWAIFESRGFQKLPCVSFVELFAGQKAVTRALRQDGRVAVSFELKDDATFEDICTPAGFAHAIQSLLMVEVGGGCLSAIVCSSWTRLNAGTSGRKARL